ncbi:hypothetical protein ACFTWD_29835 [Streptomyces sp. NPDC056943]|uniref:hypothetical protein n=1 Tax=Streptomyces sp. NPDC056943 TaxID=3345971 RepID=UPI00362E196E
MIFDLPKLVFEAALKAGVGQSGAGGDGAPGSGGGMGTSVQYAGGSTGNDGTTAQPGSAAGETAPGFRPSAGGRRAARTSQRDEMKPADWSRWKGGPELAGLQPPLRACSTAKVRGDRTLRH